MIADDTTQTMRALLLRFHGAQERGEERTMERMSRLMRREQARSAGRATGHGEEETTTMPDAVLLFEDNAGGLFLTADEEGASVYDVTAVQELSSFEPDAVALLNGDTDDWTVPVYARGEIQARLDHPDTHLIARYDDTLGRVLVVRGADGVRPEAGGAGRRYLGYLSFHEEEEAL